MNAAVIVKCEYRLLENPEFSVLGHILYSGKPKEQPQKTNSGLIYTTTLDLSVSKITAENDLLIKAIVNRKVQFRVTDANGTIYLIGNDQFPARLMYDSALDGQPGSFGGYRCTITQKSTTGWILQ